MSDGRDDSPAFALIYDGQGRFLPYRTFELARQRFYMNVHTGKLVLGKPVIYLFALLFYMARRFSGGTVSVDVALRFGLGWLSGRGRRDVLPMFLDFA